MSGRELTATEAAARLGVKKATLYAYVSRGLIGRHVALDGRTSLFNADEIDLVRSGRRTRRAGEVDALLNTALTRVADGELVIRGRDLTAVARSGRDYEDVVHRLWASTEGSWELDESALSVLSDVQSALPASASLIDRLRVSVVVVSATDPMRFDATPSGVHTAGRRMIAAMARGLPGSAPASVRRVSDVVWAGLTRRRGTALQRGALNAAMVLLIDHGMASSTFAVRVAGSVRADPYSAVATGLGVVGGTLHGAASAAVHRLLEDAHRRQDPAAAVGEWHRTASSLPGFGHAVYVTRDPRYDTLIAALAEAWVGDKRLEIVTAVRDVVAERSDALPNVDLALGALTWLAGMSDDAGEAVFAIARTAGWIAHLVEELEEPPMRFRVRARYMGA